MSSTAIRDEQTLCPKIIAILVTAAAVVVGYFTRVAEDDMVVANATYITAAIAWVVVIIRVHHNRDTRRRANERDEDQLLVLSAIQRSKVVGYMSVVAEAENMLRPGDS